MAKKVKVKSEGYEEYWSPEYKCPYCKNQGMHQFAKYCCNCGKKLNNVEFIKDGMY
jgi:hypothetical protein